MSKKISLILALLVALLGVVLVSVFGKLPEYLIPKVMMQEIYFEDEEIITNKSGGKVLYFEINKDNLSIDIYSMVGYKPLDTTNIDMTFSVSDEKMVTISKTGFLSFNEDSYRNFKSITVTVMSKDGSNLKDRLIILNKALQDSGSEEVEDLPME